MFEARDDFARQLADASGELILKHFRRRFAVEDKADDSPVTVADKGAERLMRDMISRAFPDDGIIGEEYGAEREDAEFVWVLDPVDGTRSFIAGLPLFGTLIAVLWRGKPVIGVINQPYTRERWIGVEGRQTEMNGAVVKTRPCADLEQAILYSTADELMFADTRDKRRFNALRDRVKTSRFSTDCYGYAMVASGFGDVVCEADLKLHDYAALVPIVTGAGGAMTDWRGGDLFESGDNRVLAVGDARLLPRLAEVLGE